MTDLFAETVAKSLETARDRCHLLAGIIETYLVDNPNLSPVARHHIESAQRSLCAAVEVLK